MMPRSEAGRLAHDLHVCRDGDPLPSRLRGAVAAIGNFDGVHLGHRSLIEAAAAGGEGPVGVVTFEPHPRAFFRPEAPDFRLTPEPVKLKVLGRLGVDLAFVLRFDAALAGTSAAGFVRRLTRDLGLAGVIVGENFRFGRGREGSPDMLAALAAENGLACRVMRAAAIDGAPVSSSRIRDALAAGEVDLANRLLGYRWFVTGPVIHGEKRGRTLGFPTANLALLDGCGLAHGIYAVRVALPSGETRSGVASFGRRPTFDNGAPLLEVFLFDFSGDLYGQAVDVEFLAWLRGEERFDTATALVERMTADADRARRAESSLPSFIG